MPNGISWNNVNANLSDAASFANAAQQGISSAGTIFGNAVTNLREREKMILDNAYRDRALEESIRQFDEKFNQDERFHLNEMDFKNRSLDVEEALGKERNRISWGELGYKNRSLAESIRQFNAQMEQSERFHADTLAFNRDELNQKNALEREKLRHANRLADREDRRTQWDFEERQRQATEARGLQEVQQSIMGLLAGDPSTASNYYETLNQVAQRGGTAGNAAKALLALSQDQLDTYRAAYRENSINAPARTVDNVLSAIGLGDADREVTRRTQEYQLKKESVDATQKQRNENYTKAMEKLNNRDDFDIDRAQTASIYISNLSGALREFDATLNADALVDLMKTHKYSSYWRSSKDDLTQSAFANAVKNGLRSGQLLLSKTPLNAQQLNKIEQALSLNSFATQSMYGDDVAQAITASQQSADSNAASDESLVTREQLVREYGRQPENISDTTIRIMSNPERASRLAPFVGDTTGYEPTPEEINARNLARGGFSYQQQRELRNDISEAQSTVNQEVLRTWAASDDGKRLSSRELYKLKSQRHGYRPSAEEVANYKPSDINKATNITVSRMTDEQQNETYPLMVRYYVMMSQLEGTSEKDLADLMRILREYKREMK